MVGRVALAVHFKPHAPGNLAAAPLADLPKRTDGEGLPAPLSDSFSAAAAQPLLHRPAAPVMDLTGDGAPVASRSAPLLRLLLPGRNPGPAALGTTRFVLSPACPQAL